MGLAAERGAKHGAAAGRAPAAAGVTGVAAEAGAMGQSLAWQVASYGRSNGFLNLAPFGNERLVLQNQFALAQE